MLLGCCHCGPIGLTPSSARESSSFASGSGVSGESGLCSGCVGSVAATSYRVTFSHHKTADRFGNLCYLPYELDEIVLTKAATPSLPYCLWTAGTERFLDFTRYAEGCKEFAPQVLAYLAIGTGFDLGWTIRFALQYRIFTFPKGATDMYLAYGGNLPLPANCLNDFVLSGSGRWNRIVYGAGYIEGPCGYYGLGQPAIPYTASTTALVSPA